MMFLKTNEPFFLENMDKVLPTETVKRHGSQIQFLLTQMYPHSNSKGKLYTIPESFEKYEVILGHDLFVKAIMAMSKTGKNKTVFAKGIPQVQWDQFIKEENEKHRPLPSLKLMFMATTYKHAETTKASKPVSMTSKKSKSTLVKKQESKPSRK
jgi:hypothetical protein